MGYVLPPKKNKKAWNSTIWLDFHTEMCELHVDLRKQNQPPHPEILITKFLKKIREKMSQWNAKCKLQRPQEDLLHAMGIDLYLLP